MKLLRNLILCGCTTDEAGRCPFKSAWGSGRCLCPCHFTNEQTQRLFSAYLSVPALAGNARKRLAMKTQAVDGATVPYACGHEKVFEQKPSRMAAQYVQQNICDECRELERVMG